VDTGLSSPPDATEPPDPPPPGATAITRATAIVPVAAPLTRRALRLEVVAVLALSLGASAAYAVLDLIHNLVVSIESHVALSAQTTTLYAATDTHPYLDLAYQVVGIATEVAPVLLVVYLLYRSSERLSVLGLDTGRPRRDATWAVGLAALVGAVGLGLLLAYKALGFNLNISIGSGPHYWFTAPLLVLHAAGTAVAEEVIVGSYLLHRLDQLGWSERKALLGAALLRGAYHLYQGPGQFVSNAALGLFFGRIFQRTGRGGVLVVAHFLIDAVAFVGYLELKGASRPCL
jgi:membrane protease YdiL (CAAX protease family)